VGQEAAEYLRAYLEMRHNGSKTSKIPPENIHDETPLIRNHRTKQAIPLTPSAIHKLVHDDLFRPLGCCEIQILIDFIRLNRQRAVLGTTRVPCEFAVTALLVPAGFLELRELHNNDTGLRSRFRLGSVCGAVLEFRSSTAFTWLFLLQNELLRGKPLQMNDDR